MRPALAALFVLCTLNAQDFSRLPEWASEPIRANLKEAVPSGAEAWVVLQRTDLAYAGNGEIRRRLYRLVRVLGEGGVQEASIVLPSLGGSASQIKQLKGWNLRPDGEVVKLEKGDISSGSSGATGEGYQTRRHTQGTLSRVVPGSWVAFEAMEVLRAPMGPVDVLHVLEDIPIRRWEVRLDKGGGWFSSVNQVQLRIEPIHFAQWPMKVIQGPDVLEIHDVPALPAHEPWSPAAFDILPRLHVGFLDPAFTGGPSIATWDDLARWFHGKFLERTTPFEPTPLKGQPVATGLENLIAWMRRELSYKQVYLTPERGWLPEPSQAVLQKRYGDCKDLATCFMGGARAMGLEIAPVLARIGDGHITSNQVVSPYAFNHVIAAVKLKETLGFAAEVVTPAGRFLLVDPTSRVTPIGSLPGSHRGGRVLLCTASGAQWVPIPESTMIPRGLRLGLKGRVLREGNLEGVLEIQEQGDAAGLRSECLVSNASELKASLSRLLRLPPEAVLEILQHQDPLNLGTPFRITASLSLPKAIRSSQGEVILSAVGFPDLPTPLSRSQGPPRVLPIATSSGFIWDFTLDLELPFSIVPLFPERRLETAFRNTTWKSSSDGQRIRGQFHQSLRETRFEGVMREEGIREAKRDRAALKLLQEEATAFKRLSEAP